MYPRTTSRIGLCLLLLPLLNACSSVPERYAPWQDNGDNNGGHMPNLADVPAAPDTAAAKAQMEAMRQRLEQDRDNAYLAAQGIVPISEPAPAAPAPAPASVQTSILDSELPAPNTGATNNPLMSTEMKPAPIGRGPMPPTTPVVIPDSRPPVATSNLPATNAQPAVMTNSNVLYNYDPSVGNEYTYGMNGRATPTTAEFVEPTIASDPSISIDWSALGNAAAVPETAQLAYSGSGVGEPVAYFAHGSASLGPKDRKAIRSLAKQLKQHPQPVMVAGNASKRTGLKDSAQSREINLTMSARRADAVMHELVKHGVSPEMIYLSAYGDSIPNRRRGAGDEAADRRVEIIFDK